jgi:hypothetical protein
MRKTYIDNNINYDRVDMSRSEILDLLKNEMNDALDGMKQEKKKKYYTQDHDVPYAYIIPKDK